MRQIVNPWLNPPYGYEFGEMPYSPCCLFESVGLLILEVPVFIGCARRLAEMCGIYRPHSPRHWKGDETKFVISDVNITIHVT